MRRLAVGSVALLVLVCCAIRAGAQPQPTTIDVTVFDKDGRPVRDLKASDFAVSINGRAVVVRGATLATGTASTAMVGAVGPSFDAVTPAPPVSIYRLSIEPIAGVDGAPFINITRAGVGAVVTRAPLAVASAAPSRPAPAPGSASPADRVRALVTSGRSETAIDVALGTEFRRGGGNQVLLDLAVDVPGTASAPLEALVGIINATGNLGTVRHELRTETPGGPFHAEIVLPVAPGAFTIRFAVADAAGAAGMAEAKIDATLARVGPLLASSLLRATLDREERRRAITRDRIPSDAKTLSAGLELYADGTAAPPADLLVKFALVGPGSEAAAMEKVVTPEPRDGVLAAEAEFALDRVTPGKYTLRATILSGARTLGVVSAPLER